MQKVIKFGTTTLLSMLLVSAPLLAQSQDSARPLLADHPQLRELLRKEMQALLQGLQHISAALPQGQWQTAAEHAQAMHDSYILQQNLSPAQRQTLRGVLPAGFVRLDKQFHAYAGRLAHAATAQDLELSAHFLSRAVETCMQCHQRFAPGRFPTLAPAAAHTGATPGKMHH